MNNRIQSTNQLRTKSLRRVADRRQWLMASVVGCAVFATGCGTNESEDIGSSQAALSESSCASVTADQTFSGKIDPAFVTPRSYSTCYKGYVIDISNLDPAYAGSGETADAKISVSWADTAITSQTVCEVSQVAALFYEWDVGGGNSVATAAGSTVVGGPGAGWAFLEREAEYGVWNPVLGGGCSLGVSLADLVAGKTYRVAATARTPSNDTRKVSIGTYPAVTVH